MNTLNLILSITMWTGAVLGILFGIYLNISAYKERKNKSIPFVKSSASLRGNIEDSYTMMYLSHHIEVKRSRSHKGDIFKGNLALKSEYEPDDCLV